MIKSYNKMNNGQIYAVMAFSSLFQILLIMNRSLDKNFKDQIDRPFLNLLVLYVLYCLIDGLWGICDSRSPIISQFFFNAVTYGFHSLCALSAFFWFGYMMSYMGISGKKRTILNIARFILILCQFLMIGSNIFTHEGFYFNEKLNYETGYLRSYMYLAQFIYYAIILGLSGIELLASKDKQSKRKIKHVILFSLVPLFFGILQFLYYNVAMYSIGFAITAFILYAFNIINIREKNLKEKAEKSKIDSLYDSLTGLYNRRAFESDKSKLNDLNGEEYITVFLMDLNELKKTNDDQGHEAGDELIVGASQCIKQTFGSYGTIYRIGGDEFAAILYVHPEKIKELTDDFDNVLLKWKGKNISEIHISYGYANKMEIPSNNITKLLQVADERMYKSKAEYYSNKGIDRRGQAEAFSVMCKMYKKILKINLTKDMFQIFTMDNTEKNEDMGFSSKISEWLEGFAKTGQVHPDDLEEYLQKTNITYLKNYFENGNILLDISYKRKCQEGFINCMMEITPAGDYSSTNQSLFLYVKLI